MSTLNSETELIEKIRCLPPEKLTVLKDFIDLLFTQITRSNDSRLIYIVVKLAAIGWAKINDNPDGIEYDEAKLNTFLEFCQKHGFKDANPLVMKEAIKLLELALESDPLEESAALYAEIYAEDTELQELAESGLEEWPIE